MEILRPFGVVHVYSPAVVPEGLYDLQVVSTGCVSAIFSEPLELETSEWGDLVRDCATTPCGVPDGNASFDDIVAGVDKFRNLLGAIIKARADLAPNTPDLTVDFTDVAYTVNAFLGFPYPFAGPTLCP